jgi:hypothetical protein
VNRSNLKGTNFFLVYFAAKLSGGTWQGEWGRGHVRGMGQTPPTTEIAAT